VFDDHSFALCLTHDVDRITKSYQALYYGLTEPSLYHLVTAHPDVNPYWQFEQVMALEDRLGVRSAFYFLQEPRLTEKSPRHWLRPDRWLERLGRYELTDVRDPLETLDARGWEVGMHGSYDSFVDRERLRLEKEQLEAALGHEISGGRQHHLRLSVPESWRHHRAIGLDYDASLGSSTSYGFTNGYDVVRPFDDEFVVFPLTVMEVAVMGATDSLAAAWRECERLLYEARENEAVMTVLWHPRYFNEREFPGYRRLYRRLVERAQELNAWVGPPGECYDRFDLDDPSPGSRRVGASYSPAGGG